MKVTKYDRVISGTIIATYCVDYQEMDVLDAVAKMERPPIEDGYMRVSIDIENRPGAKQAIVSFKDVMRKQD